jgi:hypothetical protein
VWYTLKDAADRGRLAASTFKQLNLAMAVVAVLQLAAYGYMSIAGEPGAGERLVEQPDSGNGLLNSQIVYGWMYCQLLDVRLVKGR